MQHFDRMGSGSRSLSMSLHWDKSWGLSLGTLSQQSESITIIPTWPDGTFTACFQYSLFWSIFQHYNSQVWDYSIWWALHYLHTLVSSFSSSMLLTSHNMPKLDSIKLQALLKTSRKSSILSQLCICTEAKNISPPLAATVTLPMQPHFVISISLSSASSESILQFPSSSLSNIGADRDRDQQCDSYRCFMWVLVNKWVAYSPLLECALLWHTLRQQFSFSFLSCCLGGKMLWISQSWTLLSLQGRNQTKCTENYISPASKGSWKKKEMKAHT